MQRNVEMRSDASRNIAHGVTSALMLMWLLTSAAAESSDLANVESCNGKNRTSAEPQIAACTVLIDGNADNPKVSAIAHSNRGNAYIRKGEYAQAIKDYDEAIKLMPNFANAFNNRGVAYQKMVDYDRAIQDFDAAINIDPNYASAFANRAETYQKMGDYPNALKDLDEAIRLQPTLKPLWNERCWTNAIVGELQAAMADCNEAIRLEPDVQHYG